MGNKAPTNYSSNLIKQREQLTLSLVFVIRSLYIRLKAGLPD